MSKLIIVVGPKHTGKSRAARCLATLLRARFCDLDLLVEHTTGKKVRELYAEGEEVFRAAETEALVNVTAADEGKTSALVIAAGGGLCDNEAAMAALLALRDAAPKRVIIAALEGPASLSWKRILQTGRIPSFLQTENPEATHRAIHNRRLERYQKIARLCVEVVGKRDQDIAAEIKERLNM